MHLFRLSSSIFVCSFAVVFLLSAFFALAETDAETSSDLPPPTVREQSRSGGMVTGEGRGMIAKHTQNRIINLSRNMTAHMEAAVLRLTQILERIDTRIAKLKTEGVETTNVEEIARAAHESLTRAAELLRDSDALVQRGITSDTPRERFADIRSHFERARDAIKDTRTHLQTIVDELKRAVREAEVDTGVNDVVEQSLKRALPQTEPGTAE